MAQPITTPIQKLIAEVGLKPMTMCDDSNREVECYVDMAEAAPSCAQIIMTTMKSCPFCGHEVDLDDCDTLYPNGTGWKDMKRGRSYHSFRDVPKEQWCYSMHCPETAGGCGCEISADSKEEAIKKWNRRA